MIRFSGFLNTHKLLFSVTNNYQGKGGIYV